jgi:hypothetical protein
LMGTGGLSNGNDGVRRIGKGEDEEEDEEGEGETEGEFECVLRVR